MATTPAQTPAPSAEGGSRESTVARGASELSARSAATDVSRAHLGHTITSPGTADFPGAGGIGAFKPFQLLLETELTIEFGGNKSKKDKRIIHQELLCCHSQGAKDIFKKAEGLRENYKAADVLRHQLKLFVPPRLSEKTFEDEHKDSKASNLIAKIYDHYPLAGYHLTIQQVVDDVITEQVGKKAVIAANTKTAVQKKDLKAMGVVPRLQALTSKGVLAVAESLSNRLREIKLQERAAATSDPLKAAAQGRIVTPGTEGRTVTSLVHWLYAQGALTYDGPEHLYAIHVLAANLGITALDQQCLAKLSSETKDAIQVALSQGLTLRQILGMGAELEGNDSAPPASNVVQVVFQHILKDQKAPKRLVDLVVNTLAVHLDPELWDELVTMVNAGMKGRLIKALLVHRQVKPEDAETLSVKSESTSSGDGYVTFAMNEQS